MYAFQRKPDGAKEENYFIWRPLHKSLVANIYLCMRKHVKIATAGKKKISSLCFQMLEIYNFTCLTLSWAQQLIKWVKQIAVGDLLYLLTCSWHQPTSISVHLAKTYSIFKLQLLYMH